MLGRLVLLYLGLGCPSAQCRVLPDPAILEKVECLDGAMNIHIIYQHSLLPFLFFCQYLARVFYCVIVAQALFPAQLSFLESSPPARMPWPFRSQELPTRICITSYSQPEAPHELLSFLLFSYLFPAFNAPFTSSLATDPSRFRSMTTPQHPESWRASNTPRNPWDTGRWVTWERRQSRDPPTYESSIYLKTEGGPASWAATTSREFKPWLLRSDDVVARTLKVTLLACFLPEVSIRDSLRAQCLETTWISTDRQVDRPTGRQNDRPAG